MSITYTINNLPSGFKYNPQDRTIYSPVTKHLAKYNEDETVTNGYNITFMHVDHYVQTHLYMLTPDFVNRPDMASQPFKSTRFPNGYIVMKESTLLIISILITAAIVTGVMLSVHLPTWWG